MEGAECLTPSPLPQLHQGAQEILRQGEGTSDDRTGQKCPVGVTAFIDHGGAFVHVLGVKEVDMNNLTPLLAFDLVNELSKQIKESYE